MGNRELAVRTTTGWIACAVWVAFGLSAGPSPGLQPPVPVPFPGGPVQPSLLEHLPSETTGLLTRLIVNNVPREFVDEKQWGKQKRIFAGWHISTDGLRLQTKRKWKEVNHGTWRRYEIHLIKPEKHLRAELTNLRPAPNDQVAFDLSVSARVLVLGRAARWEHGVQLYNLSAEAETDVDLLMQGVLGMTIDPTTLPPDVILKPHITAAELRASRLRMRRISKADGPLVRELGSQLEDVLQRKLADQQDRLVEKLNRALVQHEDDLRLSLHDLVANQMATPSESEPSVTADAPGP